MATVRVGVLNDVADFGSGTGAASDEVTDWLEREVERLRACGRIAATVEFVHAYGMGLPTGTAEAIERAYLSLVSQDVVLIVGPSIGDNASIATPLAERLRVPTINCAGTERARGKYMFHLPVGSHEDEGLVMARHLAAGGARRLGVVHDMSPIATRQLAYLEEEAAILGLEVVARQQLSASADGPDSHVAATLSANPDAVVYLGASGSAPAVAQALGASGWQGARIMNSAGLCGYQGDVTRALDGWSYIDMHADSNRTLQALRETFNIPAQEAPSAARGHDLGRLVAEGIARAHGFTREGLRNGLEQVKWLPAAQGQDGTLLGFGIHDRGALHGRYLVVRRWENGVSVEAHA